MAKIIEDKPTFAELHKHGYTALFCVNYADSIRGAFSVPIYCEDVSESVHIEAVAYEPATGLMMVEGRRTRHIAIPEETDRDELYRLTGDPMDRTQVLITGSEILITQEFEIRTKCAPGLDDDGARAKAIDVVAVDGDDFDQRVTDTHEALAGTRSATPREA